LNTQDARSRGILPILVLALSILVTPARAAGPDPVDHSQPAAPDGTPICAKWVHDRYTTLVNGRRWPTWHPARDPRYQCAFGHEHGSNPRAFRYFSRTGMPAFGPIGTFAGDNEPHNGFKVFLTNDDGHGLAWMMVLHQGSGSPKRGTVRFHSLELWLFRNRDRRLIAHTRVMADFGREVPNCGGRLPRGGWRLIPAPSCGSAKEEWTPALNVGGALRAKPAFLIQNPITQFDPLDPSRLAFNKPSACGRADPGGWRSHCKGDRRVVLHPEWRVRNRGPAGAFRTDAYGRRAATGLLQRISRRVRVNQGAETGGIDNAFVMERPSDGGIYRPGRGYSSTGFEHYGYCVLRSN
jgi:hypothetical protein